MAGVVVILHLRLGQRGLFHGGPHHGLGPLIERAVHQEGHEFVGDHRFGVVIHREVGVGPVAGHAQALEFLALDIDPAFGEAAAFLAEGDDIHVILVQALGAVLFLDLPFDRQAVAIPSRHITGIAAHHLLAAHDHVFQDLVQRMADVQMPVGIGGAVMQGEGLARAVCQRRLFAQPVIDADPRPARQPVRFALGQARAHRKVGFRQEDGVAVVCLAWAGGIGAHRMRSLKTGDDRAKGGAAGTLSRRLKLSAPGR